MTFDDISGELLVTPDPNGHRPLDVIEAAGSPAHPVPFDSPNLEPGRRGDVFYCSGPKGSKARKFTRVKALYRTENPDQAYWTIPSKPKRRTIMGHVEICLVLTRIKEEDASIGDDLDSFHTNNSNPDLVFECTKQYVAIKVNYRMEELKHRRLAEDPYKEVAAMQLCGCLSDSDSHPNVLGMMEALWDDENGALNVVMPYYGSGDLFDALTERRFFPEPLARYWFRQILSGLHYLHTVKGICHRDLSPENVMMDKDGCVIIDMGMAIRIPHHHHEDDQKCVCDISKGKQRRLIKPQGACGKLPYMSPEIFQNQIPFDGSAVDIWTLGTILFCMVTGKTSYEFPNNSCSIFFWMTNDMGKLLNHWNVDLSPECFHLLQNMIQIDPRLRLTLEEVLDHPWMALPDAPPPSAS